MTGIAGRLLLALAGACAALAGGAPAFAQIVSAAPDKVGVTIYRAPDRAPDGEMNADWLQGYALVTERRTVRIPAGKTTIRFEGVAAGILPESAIVSGLPGGVREKNLDADLLSSRSLYAGSFGRPVTVRRTLKGMVTEEPAIVRSGPDGAAIVQTRDGFAALNCGPHDESLLYNGVPPGLSAKPTLSIAVESPQAMAAVITLSYLAWGFDWQANYVATLRPDGKSADLMGWVTLASSDTTSFPTAETMVVAGKVKREDRAPYGGLRGGNNTLVFACFAHPIVFPAAMQSVMGMAAPAPSAVAMDIVVTGARRSMAQQEDLGDLKLYRIPDRTTVAAMAQKQVAMLDRKAIPVDVVYVASLNRGGSGGNPMIALRAVNRQDKGLGLPLPAGPVAVFEPHRGALMLVGEGAIGDKAIGENVEIIAAQATQVTLDIDDTDSGDDWDGYVMTVRNANPFPIRFEAAWDAGDTSRLVPLTGKIGRRDGRSIWAIEIPANGSRDVRYRLKDED